MGEGKGNYTPRGYEGGGGGGPFPGGTGLEQSQKLPISVRLLLTLDHPLTSFLVQTTN
jgi:hypothetical protein